MDIGQLWDFGDPAESEARFRAAAQAASEPEAAVLLTQAARALGLQGRFAEGHEMLDSLARQGDAQVRARVQLERGRLMRSAGDESGSHGHFVEAAALAAAAGQEGLEIDALHMVALTLTGDEQLEVTLQALERARASTQQDASDWVPSLLNNLGMAHADAGRWSEALASFEEALTARQSQGKAEPTRVARWMVAWALRNLGRAEEALAIQRDLRRYGLDRGIEDPYVDEELALLGDHRES